MKLALAQIDMRLGDIESICSRIIDQASIAASEGATLFCVPAPLLTGMQPTSLIDYANFEHDIIASLEEVAAHVEKLGIVCVVPAVVVYENVPLFEAFILKDGRVIPSRSIIAQQHGMQGDDAWLPPVFDVDGTRVAVTFDLARDLDSLPCGTDMVLYFQVNGFDETNSLTCAVASVRDGGFANEAARSGMWMACMAPLGGYDESVFTGGSFVMDDAGRVVAASPCFEEDLLIVDVRHGLSIEPVESDALPRFCREEWVWHALELHMRDMFRARGFARAVLPLDGGLASALLAALAVDALGSRNVIGFIAARDDAITPAQEAYEQERLLAARAMGERLHIRVVERDDTVDAFDRDAARSIAPEIRAQLEALLLSDVAAEYDAGTLYPATKTSCALAAESVLRNVDGRCVCLPFGDVYLSELESLARWRNGVSPVIPGSAVCLAAVEREMQVVVSSGLRSFIDNAEYMGQMAKVLAPLSGVQLDSVLKEHVDRNMTFEEISLSADAPEAVAALMLLVQRGESARRMLPLVPVLSARSFAERAWPRSLGWFDTGRRGSKRFDVAALVQGEIEHAEQKMGDYGDRARSEIMGLLGSLFGITPEQLASMQSPEGRERMKQNFESLESKMREMMERGAGEPDGFPSLPNLDVPEPPSPRSFFSQN